MTRDFENMLYLFGSGATGSTPKKENCVNIRRIRELAVEQNVWPIVYSAVRKKLISGEVKIPDEIYKMTETSFEANIARNLQKEEFTKNIIEFLEKNGVRCCLFKGAALARLYNIPQTRVSGDTDILIKEEDEKKAAELLKQKGYDVRGREANEHHMKAYHPIGGEMEVHVALMKKNWDNIIFSDKAKYNEEYIEMENGIKTFGINDGLINTVTHFIKHFVRSGAGVRHLMDLLLYMEKFKDRINWEEFNSFLEELNYKKLIDTVKKVGVKYWGMDFEDCGYIDDSLAEKLLDDMEKGGIFGDNDFMRKETYARFVQKRKKLTADEYKKFSMTKTDKTIFQKIFPDREYMKRNYGLKDDAGFLKTGFLHIKRYGCIVKNLVKGEKDINVYLYGEGREISIQVQERVTLFEELGIID